MRLLRSNTFYIWLAVVSVGTFLLRNGYLLIDEEFFIIVAFLSFLVFIYGQVASVLEESMTNRIAFYGLGFTQIHGISLRTAVMVYGFYAHQLELLGTQRELRLEILKRLELVPAVRSKDILFYKFQHTFQLMRTTASLSRLLDRTVALTAFYEMWGGKPDPVFLQPFLRDEEFAFLEKPVKVKDVELETNKDRLDALYTLAMEYVADLRQTQKGRR